MTPRSLFTIILRVLGLFFVKDFLATIPQLLSSILFLTRSDAYMEGIWIVLSTLAILVVYWFVCYYLIFKTDLIIDQLKLDKGFTEETIALNTHRSTILSISVIVIGGYMVVNEIPFFCRQVFLYFQQKRMTQGFTNASTGPFIMSAVKILVGIFMMAGQRQIVNFIELRRKK